MPGLNESNLEGENPEAVVEEGTPLLLSHGEEETRHEADLRIAWDPWPMVALESSIEPAPLLEERFWVQLPELSLKCRIFPVETSRDFPADGGGSVDLRAFIEDSTLYPGRNRRFVEMTAYLPGFHLPWVRDSASFSFWMHGWRVAVEPLVVERDDRRAVENLPGTFITHRIKVERTGRRWFREATGKDMLSLLGSLFTFVRGDSCHPLLASGTTTTGREFWLRLRVNSSSRDHFGSWVPKFEELDREQAWIPALKQLAPGFGRLYREFPEVLKRVVYWLKLGNTETNVESALLRTQVGLETLTSIWEERGWFNAPGSTHQNVESMLDRVNAGHDIPDELKTIPSIRTWRKRYADQGNSIDSGPEVITRARNAVVHLDQSKLRLNRGLLSDLDALRLIQLLGASYIENLVLYLCDYEGEIRNRVSGASEPAPWAPDEELAALDI